MCNMRVEAHTLALASPRTSTHACVGPTHSKTINYERLPQPLTKTIRCSAGAPPAAESPSTLHFL